MSSFAETLCHPVNKNQVPVYRGFNWPCFFFGPIWFAVKGMWLWALGSLAISAMTCGFSWLVFPFFANGLHRKHLLNAGYLSVAQAHGAQPIPGVMQVQQPMYVQQPVPVAFVNPSPVMVQGSTMTPPLAGVNIPSQGLPTFASNSPRLPGSFKSHRFLLVRSQEKMFSAKFTFLIVDVDTPGLLFTIGTTMTLMNSFNTTVRTLDGTTFLQIKGGGITSPLTTEVSDSAGNVIGSVKRKGMLELHEFQAFDAAGNLLFDTKAKDKGFASNLFLQIIANGQPTAELKELDIDVVKQQIGTKWEQLDTKNWQSISGYGGAEPYLLEINTDVGDLTKTMLFVLMFSARWIRSEGR